MNDAPRSPQLRKIRFISLILKWACWVAMLAPPLFTLGALCTSHLEGTSWTVDGVAVDHPTKPWGQFATTWAIGFLPQVALIWGFNQLRLLFGGFAAGRIFNPHHVAHLLRFGKAVLVYAVAGVVARSISYTLTKYFEGERLFNNQVNDDDVQYVLIGLFFWVLGWIFREGARLAEENAQIV